MSELRVGLGCMAARHTTGVEKMSPSRRTSAGVRLDYVLAALLLAAASCAFMYGNGTQRLVVLILSLASGLFRPPLLIFSLSLATSLDVANGHFFTPMRVALIFSAATLLVHHKHISERIRGEHLLGLAYLWVFGMWCLLCIYIRAQLSGLEEVITMFGYGAACLFLLAIVEKKDSMSTFVWLGLLPSVVSSVAASFHLRPLKWHDYLITADGPRYRGILHDPNYLSSILVVGFTVCLASMGVKKGMPKKALYLVLSALFSFALWAPQSRAGLYTASFCLALFILSQAGPAVRGGKWKNLLPPILIAGAVVLFIATHTHNRAFSVVRERGFELVRSINRLAVEPILRNPVFGPGEAGFDNLYGPPHNTLLSLGLEYGIPGMLLMLVGISFCFYNLWKRRGKGSMVIFLPFLALNVILCSFSATGHKLLWLYLVAGMVYRPDEPQIGEDT